MRNPGDVKFLVISFWNEGKLVILKLNPKMSHVSRQKSLQANTWQTPPFPRETSCGNPICTHHQQYNHNHSFIIYEDLKWTQ